MMDYQYVLEIEEGKHYFVFRDKMYLFDPIKDWCQDHIGSIVIEERHHRRYEYFQNVKFSSLADMIAFRMRWL